jgi:hypothetical protein
MLGIKDRSNRNNLTSWRINVLIPNFKVSLKSFFNGIRVFYQKNRIFATGEFFRKDLREGLEKAPENQDNSETIVRPWLHQNL